MASTTGFPPRDGRLLAATLASGGYVLAVYVATTVLLVTRLDILGSALAGAAGLFLLAFAWVGPSLTLAGLNGTAVDPADRPTASGALRRHAAVLDVPTPSLAVIDAAEPNALTVGTGGDATICVTAGLLQALDDRELSAVLAHELSHAAHRDSTVLAVAAFPALVGRSFVHVGVGVVRSGFRDSVFTGIAAALIGVPLAAAGVAVALVALPGTVVLSRTREYAADRGAVAATGDPAALASALARIDGGDPTPTTDARLASAAAFCLVRPSGALLPWTHPSAVARIDRLEAAAAAVESAGETP